MAQDRDHAARVCENPVPGGRMNFGIGQRLKSAFVTCYRSLLCLN